MNLKRIENKSEVKVGDIVLFRNQQSEVVAFTEDGAILIPIKHNVEYNSGYGFYSDDTGHWAYMEGLPNGIYLVVSTVLEEVPKEVEIYRDIETQQINMMKLHRHKQMLRKINREVV